MIECAIRTGTGKNKLWEKVNILIRGTYSIPYMEVQCWHTGSSSKNEAKEPKKNMISPDKEMEMNFVSTKVVESITTCS